MTPLTPRLLQEAYVKGHQAYETDPKARAEIDSLNIRLYNLITNDPMLKAQTERVMKKYKELTT